jgi:hypothetical protein
MTTLFFPIICWTIILNLKPADLAYMASAIDNDGSIYTRLILKDEGIGVLLSFGVQVSQKTKFLDYLERFKTDTGFGKAEVRRGGESNMSDWVVIKQDEIPVLLKALLPYFRIKKEQAELEIKIVEKYSKLPKANTKKNTIKRAEGVYELLPLIDRLAKLNDGSNRKVTGEVAFEAMRKRGFLLDKDDYKSP